MELLGLPLDLVADILAVVVKSEQVVDLLSLRRANRLFDQEIIKQLARTRREETWASFRPHGIPESLKLRLVLEIMGNEYGGSNKTILAIHAVTDDLSARLAKHGRQLHRDEVLRSVCRCAMNSVDILARLRQGRVRNQLQNEEKNAELAKSSFTVAISSRYMEVQMEFLHGGLDPDFDTRNFGMPLEVASRCGYADTVETLLSFGADINRMSQCWQRTALQAAAAHGHVDIVRGLLKRNSKLNVAALNFGSAASIAVMNQYPHITSMILDRIPKIGTGSRKSICLWASIYGYDELVLRMIDAGVPPNNVRNERCWAIEWAAKNGHCSTVNLLLEEGSSIRNAFGKAAHAGQIGVLDMMMKRDIDYKVGRKTMFEAFVSAAEAGQIVVGQFLLGSGLDFKTPQTTSWGYVAVAKAINNNRPEMVRWLFSKLELCPDGQKQIHESDDLKKYGQTAPMIAALCFGRTDIVIQLFLIGAQPLDLSDKSISDQIRDHFRSQSHPGISCKTKEALEIHRMWAQGLGGIANRPATSAPLHDGPGRVGTRPKDYCYCGKNCDSRWC